MYDDYERCLRQISNKKLDGWLLIGYVDARLCILTASMFFFTFVYILLFLIESFLSENSFCGNYLDCNFFSHLNLPLSPMTPKSTKISAFIFRFFFSWCFLLIIFCMNFFYFWQTVWTYFNTTTILFFCENRLEWEKAQKRR